MSQGDKKPILLSAKHISKTKQKQLTSKNDEMVSKSVNLDDFIPLSTTKHESSKDDSPFSLGSSLKDNFSVEDKDVFQFPGKSKISLTDCNADPGDKEQSINQTSDLNDSLVLFQHNSCVKSSKLAIDKDNLLMQELDEDIVIPSKCEQLKIDAEKSSDGTEESKKQCPVCLKFTASGNYVNHIKSCASKNSIDTQKLLDALKLHKKQLAERKELGLDVPVQSFRARVSPKRRRVNDKKGAVDANLQLALALSASLRSAEEKELIEEAEALNTAGLSEEAHQKLSTLERFGFSSQIPVGVSKGRCVAPTLLQVRSQNERERIVTEKVAIILISEEENSSLEPLNCKEPTLSSKILKQEWNKVNLLWGKSQRLDMEERSVFYVKDFSEFINMTEALVEKASRIKAQLPKSINSPVFVL